MAGNHAKNPVDMTAAAKIAYHKHVRTQMAVAKALYDSGNVNLTITVLEGLLETTHCSFIVRLKAQIMLALSHELWAFTEKHRLLAESLWNRIRYIEPVGEDQFIETTPEETRQTFDKLRTLQEEKQPLDDEYDPDDRGSQYGTRGKPAGAGPGQAAMKLSAMYQGVAVYTTPEYNKAVESGDMEVADSFFWEMLKKAFSEGEATAKRRVKQPATAPSQGKPELAQTPKSPSSKKKRQWFTQKAENPFTFVQDTEGSPDKKEQDTDREIEPPKFVFPIRKKEEKEIVAPLVPTSEPCTNPESRMPTVPA
ncbi:hypothetical protein D6D13_06102 [Aureobasidium pullulans]|uniref:Uncharacterized protein n=1 Tax=Aureobasidium pullulans TaxID=5580 RepID=A0A4S9CSI9_AURPU|nr:hypothetical protein D6D13_06102 [Aureobasidium pullulans]